jgi:hypothetical protein
MSNEDNVKIMKLSNGEEIIARLIEPVKPTKYIIEYPLKLSSTPKSTKYGVEEAISLQRWIHFSTENTFDVPSSSVIIITNASYGLIKFYEHCLNRMEAEDKDFVPSPSMRDLDGIEDEDLFDDLDDYRISSKLLH